MVDIEKPKPLEYDPSIGTAHLSEQFLHLGDEYSVVGRTAPAVTLQGRVPKRSIPDPLARGPYIALDRNGEVVVTSPEQEIRE